MTINRFCSSGAAGDRASSADRIALGAYEVGIAGGVETMSMIPMGGNKPSLNPELVEKRPDVYTPMGITAENIARRFGTSRARSRTSSRCARTSARTAAWTSGKFDAEIVAVKTTVFDAEGNPQDLGLHLALGPGGRRALMRAQRELVLRLARDSHLRAMFSAVTPIGV